MGLLNLEEQLAFYRRYHSNKINVAIHMIFVPTIHFTTTLLVANAPLGKLVERTPYANVGVAAAAATGVYYTALDWKFGIPTAAAFVAASLKATDLLGEYGPLANKVAGGICVISWLAQFAGHKWAEKKAPALLDNLVQALVLAPFFVVFEYAYMLGIRTGVIDRIDMKIAAEDAIKKQ